MELTKKVHDPTMENYSAWGIVFCPASPCHVTVRIRGPTEDRSCQSGRSLSRCAVALVDNECLRRRVQHTTTYINQRPLHVSVTTARTVLGGRGCLCVVENYDIVGLRLRSSPPHSDVFLAGSPLALPSTCSGMGDRHRDTHSIEQL